MFFLLSGFVLSYTYLNRQGDMRGSRRGFWAARFARIYPAYLLAFLLAAPTNLLWTLHVNHGAAAALKLVTGGSAVLGMVQAWTPWTAWYWNYPAWSVSVEVFFYLSFPFLAPLVGRVQKKSTCVLAMFGLWTIALAAPVALYLTRHITTAPGLNDHLQMAVEFTPLLRLPEFLIGVLLGRLFVLGCAMRPRLSRGLSYASAGVVIAVLCFSAGIPHPILANGLLAPLFAVLILSLAHGEGLLAKFLSLGYVMLLGEASYGLYILQIPVAYVLHVLPPHLDFRTFALYATALISISILSLRFFEIPMRRRLKRWLSPVAAR
jgi:peptidoglycan/LPS O-acetylase OafA/YrhL